MKYRDLQFSALNPLLVAAGLPEITDADKRLCALEASALEAMTHIESNHPKEAWETLKTALQEVK